MACRTDRMCIGSIEYLVCYANVSFDNNSYSKMVKLSIHFVSEHEPKSFNNWDVLWQFSVALVVRCME